MARKRGVKKWMIVVGVLLVTFTGAGVALRASFKTDTKIDPSKLALVVRGDVARSVVATGKVEPRTKAEVKSKASGIVKQVLVEYGTFVKKGQPLVELDKEELQARLREATALLEGSQAAEEAALASLERHRVEAEGPDVPFLKSSLERAKKLQTQGLIASNALEDADRAYQMALHKQNTAQRNIAVARAEVTKSRAQVAQSRAALERAQEDLRNSTVVSPMNGLVLSRDVEVGDAVSSILVLGSQATLVATIGDVSDVYVLGKVDQADVGKVYLGQQARIVVESFKDKKFLGQVTKISPLGVEKDNVTTFEVRVSIQNPSLELKANMSANAEVILEEKKGVLIIPENAVVYDRERRTFAEVPDATAEKGKKQIPIKIGISNGVKTELVSGLRDGAQVILQ